MESDSEGEEHSEAESDFGDICGDGEVSGAEVCDDGINDGTYGGCNPDCMSLANHCGDAKLNGPEVCDDGNLDSADGCLDDCTVPTSCEQLLEHDDTLEDGFYLIAPSDYGDEPFVVYCDMTTDGGGWAVIFKNHGGGRPGELSNDELLDGDPGDYAGPITPHTDELVSGVNVEAWDYYRAAPGHEWLKIGTIWDPLDTLVHEQTIRADFGDVTWDWILSLASNEPCHVAPNPISLVANGDQSLGQTDRVNSGQANRITFGLANDGHDSADSCEQPASNLIRDPNEVLYRLDGGETLNGIRHLFSYRHTSAGADASRCQFTCWSEQDLDYYDGFTWLVR